MSILNLLTKEKKIAGIEISDSFVRVVFFRVPQKATKGKNKQLVLIEEVLPGGIIDQGIVTDKIRFSKTLKNIWSKVNFDADYAIVAIPNDKIFSRIFSFPRTVQEYKLRETMDLVINYQLPMKADDIYLGWEHVSDSHLLKEILLSSIRKDIANSYIEAFEMAGIKILALESLLASIGRTIKLNPDNTTIFAKTTPASSTIFILKGTVLRFARVLPNDFLSANKLKAEIQNIKTSFEADAKEPIIEISLDDVTIRDEYAVPEISKLTPEARSKWLPALGALIRGEIPRGEDQLISLLPVGTKEAYAYQKATTFFRLIQNLTVGVSVFFVCAFIAVYAFIFVLSEIATRATTSFSIDAVSPELLAKENLINKVNTLTSASGNILATTPVWSALLENIEAHIIDGITISNFSAPSILDQMSLVGTARDRSTLNQFKKSLQDSESFTEVDLPLTNLEQKGDIPFSISFRLKNPSVLYYK